jgi:hypothetical protein
MPEVTPYHGKTGRVGVGATPAYLQAAAWDMHFEVDDDDASTFESGGWGVQATGLIRGSGTIEVVATDAEDILNGTNNLRPGAVVACTLQAYTGYIFTGPAQVKGVKVGVNLKGVVKFTCAVKTQGAWTWPTVAGP